MAIKAFNTNLFLTCRVAKLDDLDLMVPSKYQVSNFMVKTQGLTFISCPSNGGGVVWCSLEEDATYIAQTALQGENS
jgi:hypothetical protein